MEVERPRENILKVIAREFDYEDKEIDDAMRKHSFTSAGDLVDHLWVTNETRLKDPLRKIHKGTRWFFREQRCLCCKKKARDTVFLPCGDFVVCHCCARKVMNCPNCGETITDFIPMTKTENITDKSEPTSVDTNEPTQCSTPVDTRQPLLKETSRLYRERMCPHCKTEERNVVFLPCSHLAACRQCAPRVENCMCGVKIEHSIITFMM